MDIEIGSTLQVFSAWCEGERNRLNLPGIAAGLFTGGDLYWFGAFGAADLSTGEPFTRDTRFRIASISKLFTSTAVMQLRDRGLLELDAPVKEYLPWFSPKQMFSTVRPITVRQLLLHTAGLPRESGQTYWDDPEKFPTREELKSNTSSIETAYPPDVQYKYSNFGMAVAGEIVSAVSGESFESFVRQQLLLPLGLEQTLVSPAFDTPGLAKGYLRHPMGLPRKQAPFTDCRGIAPAANLCSTIGDLARFFSFHFSNSESEILSLESRQEMHRAHWLDHDWKSARGLGFRIRRIHDQTLIGHEGWVTGYRSYVSFIPQEGFGLVFLINSDDITPFYFCSRAVELLVPAMRSFRKKQSPSPRLLNPERYCGYFRNTWEDSAVLVEDGALYLVFLSDANPVESRCLLEPESENVFRIRGTDGSPPIGERAVFEFEGQTTAQRIRMGDSITYRV